MRPSQTEAGHNYTQIEKEIVKCFLHVEKFKQYVYGKAMVIQTDHKLLEMIISRILAQRHAVCR